MFDLIETKRFFPMGPDGPEILYRGMLAGEQAILTEMHSAKARIRKDHPNESEASLELMASKTNGVATYKLMSRCIVDLRGISIRGKDVDWESLNDSKRSGVLDLFQLPWITKLTSLIIAATSVTQEEERTS